MGSKSSKPAKLTYKPRPEEQNLEEQDVPETKAITVLIPLNSGFWEKSYNIETPLNKIASDFKEENNMNVIKKNYFIEWSFKNSPIEMGTSPLKSLLNANDDLNTIHIAQEIKRIPDMEDSEIDEKIDIVGKPFSEPFEIFTFELKKRVIRTKLYNQDKIKEIKLDKFGVDSAYCNGNNLLFISGGVDHDTNGVIDLFWEIDIQENIFRPPVKMNPKKNHSMIYSCKKVYIVGGDDESTMIYDENSKKIIQWANLNQKRFEPSLIRHNNYLFCFDTSKKLNSFNFEKIDLNSSSAKWELVTPSMSTDIKDSVFCQKFFGVVEDFRENIVFVGGMYDKDIKGGSSNTDSNECLNFQYNINKNMIENSDIKFKDISFNEKTFLPFDKKTYFLLPNFNKHSPKVTYFFKDKNIIETDGFHPPSNNKKKEKIIKTIQAPSLNQINLNMPKFENETSDNGFQTTVRDPSVNNNNFNNNNINNISNNLNDEIQTPKIEENINKPKIKVEINPIIPTLKEDDNNIEEMEKKINEPENNNISNINNNEAPSNLTVQPEKKNNIKLDKRSECNSMQLLYVERPISLLKFHSSNYVPANENDNMLRNIGNKKIKKQRIIPPKNISIKAIKKQMSQFYKVEINEFKEK